MMYLFLYVILEPEFEVGQVVYINTKGCINTSYLLLSSIKLGNLFRITTQLLPYTKYY